MFNGWWGGGGGAGGGGGGGRKGMERNGGVDLVCCTKKQNTLLFIPIFNWRYSFRDISKQMSHISKEKGISYSISPLFILFIHSI